MLQVNVLHLLHLHFLIIYSFRSHDLLRHQRQSLLFHLEKWDTDVCNSMSTLNANLIRRFFDARNQAPFPKFLKYNLSQHSCFFPLTDTLCDARKLRCIREASLCSGMG